MASKLIVLLSFLITQVLCKHKNSLTFVIDDTISMYDDIQKIKNAAKSIVDIVLNENSSQIEDIVLVTFNDPGTLLRNRTRNAEELKQSLDEILVHDGGDCPEMSLSGLKLALLESQPGSYLYVFTDASAKDHMMFEEIKLLCQEKQSQVVFVLTGDCYDTQSPRYQVYYKIAAASNGQVLRISKNEVKQVLEYVKETIKGDRSVTTSKVIPALTWTYVPFTIDDKSEYAIVSASGSKVELQIEDPLHSGITDYIPITSTENVKVIKLTNLRPGQYNAKVYGRSEVNIMVFARTDFTFKYGFLSNVETPLKLAETQPTTGTQFHLIIFVNDPENSVTVNAVEILDMNERVLSTVPLLNLGGPPPTFSSGLYATEKFTPPDQMFKIAVTASARRSGEPIRRIAKTPVTPIKPVTVAPEISDSEKVIKAKEDSAVDIHCRIQRGKPKPHVTWHFKQQGAEGFMLMEDRTDYVLRVTGVAPRHAGQYKCVAENSAGRAEHIVQLDVEGV